MNKRGESITIGVLGGMGTYATIHLFNQYARLFVANKEWERPRIIIDNRCTMPSRVKAYLEGDDKDKLIIEMSESIDNLIRSGCNRIIIDCNTAHLFIPDIYSKVPKAEGLLVNIIDTLVDELSADRISRINLLASEGTIDSKIYQKACENKGIICNAPCKEEYILIRKCIEAVKRDEYSNEIQDVFLELIHKDTSCILGCTELPILYDRYKSMCDDVRIYDPIYLTLKKIRHEFRE